MAKKLLLFSSFALLLVVITTYSFSQIDLNLTLSSNLIYQEFQKAAINLGYFNRPLATVIFLILVILFSSFYLLFSRWTQKDILPGKSLAVIIGISILTLLPSYPAFSHDIFNYMFDAKVITTYGQNPYFYKALDFPNDPWLRFMHWTHRYYPYGPLWLAITLIPSALGFGKLVLTLFNFKLLIMFSHIVNITLIGKILEMTNPSKKYLGIAIYALNPLILIEVLVNAHLDTLMLTFALLGFYFTLKNKTSLSAILIVLSALIKFITGIFLLPLAASKILNKNFSWLIEKSLLLFFLALAPIILSREAYPWYFIPAIGLLALMPEKRITTPLALIISLSTLLRYAPYLYFGDYKSPVPETQNLITTTGTFLAIIIILRARRLGGREIRAKSR